MKKKDSANVKGIDQERFLDNRASLSVSSLEPLSAVAWTFLNEGDVKPATPEKVEPLLAGDRGEGRSLLLV